MKLNHNGFHLKPPSKHKSPCFFPVGNFFLRGLLMAVLNEEDGDDKVPLSRPTTLASQSHLALCATIIASLARPRNCQPTQHNAFNVAAWWGIEVNRINGERCAEDHPRPREKPSEQQATHLRPSVKVVENILVVAYPPWRVLQPTHKTGLDWRREGVAGDWGQVTVSGTEREREREWARKGRGSRATREGEGEGLISLFQVSIVLTFSFTTLIDPYKT